MSTLFEQLAEQLGGDAIGQISRQIGADEESTSRAVSGALPMMMAALTRNAQSPDGAASLFNALKRDHDGGLLDDLGGFLGHSESGPGDAILGHIFGNRRNSVENGLSQMSGLNLGKIGKLLPILAPILLAALGRKRRSRQFDSGGLTDFLNTERRQVEKTSPREFSMLESFLDRDGDAGDIVDNLPIAISIQKRFKHAKFAR